MFIYVFSEADREKMEAAGFAFVCRDDGAKAFVFEDASGNHSVPDGVEKVTSSRLAFCGTKEHHRKGGGQHGTANDAAL